MTKRLRHHGSHREDDGAIDWNTLLLVLCLDYENENAWDWTIPEWLDLLESGSDRNRFQYCLNLDGIILYVRAVQGHSGGTKVDPTLLDNVLIPYKWSEYLCHVGCSLYLHSMIHSGLIAGRKDAKEDRQTVFFTWTPKSDGEEEEYRDVSKPRKLHHKSKWKVIQDAIDWIHLRGVPDKGLKNFDKLDLMPLSTLQDSVPAYNIERVVNTKTKERFCIRKFHYLHVHHFKNILKEAWQVQRDNSHQRGTRMGNLQWTRKRKSLRLTSESKVFQKQQSFLSLPTLSKAVRKQLHESHIN